MNPAKKVCYAVISRRYPTPAEAWPHKILTPDANAPVPPGQNRATSAGSGRRSDRRPRTIRGGESVNP